MKISDWNLEDYDGVNVLFDIIDSSHSLLCTMSLNELENMKIKIEQIIEEKLEFNYNQNHLENKY